MKETYATIDYVNELKTNGAVGCDQSINKKCDLSSQQSQHVIFTQDLCVEPQNGVTLNEEARRASQEVPPPSAGVCAKVQNLSTAHARADVDVLKATNIISKEQNIIKQNLNENVSQDVLCTDDYNKNKMSMADMVRQGGAWKVADPDQEWKEFQRRKLRNRQDGVKGKAAIGPDDKFKPAEIKISLFLTNVHKDTSEDDVAEYIRSKTKQKISLQKINMKTEKTYNAYKIIVNRNALDIFLNNEIWPDGVICRRFRPYRPIVQNGEQI